MQAETIRNDAHEQMSEVLMAILNMFDTTEINQVTPYTPVVMEIMKLPRPQRKSIGIGLVNAFFTEHAINIENSSERLTASAHVPMIVWAIKNAAEQVESVNADRALPEVA